ncbi:hypothetical protein H4R21_005611 [Coemansia helicoidea]|uniref:Uncharacterized protein n=1 Tax=Coemansia helicoidea TaxID=1286919 RepID=A0ACC1KSX3_9FUNG|nr:hypothetical protein H4R21_005611 [Coemansia helicoidea]
MGLAEAKSRTMYAADPRNLHWSQDKGRFGFRMLEKMGWSEGKGLGANEDGQKEHVKIKLKTNAHGVGADKKTIRNWLAHSSGFDELLGRLNAATDGAPEPDPAPVAEAKPSGAAGQRLSHRARFRRMKQMAVQDERGLQEILGISTRQAPRSDAGGLQETKTTSAALSTADYFASKMADNPALAALYGLPSPAPTPAEDSDAAAAPLEPARSKRRSRDDSGDETKAKKSKKDKKDRKKKDKKDKSHKSKDKKEKAHKKEKKDKKKSKKD